MNRIISTEEASSKLSELLIGSSIDKVYYYITGWELRFIGKDGLETNLSASEITIPNEDKWWGRVSDLPIDINNTNEASDTLSAIVIFTATNKWPITDIAVDKNGNIDLHFKNGAILNIMAIVENVDWTWQINNSAGENLITCDSGSLYGNSDYFQS
jgi:hypothetical protein